MATRFRAACAGSAFSFCVAAALWLVLSETGTASDRRSPEKAATNASVVRWLAPVTKSSARRAERKLLAQEIDRRHGGGSYICSPAGFGQRSRCVLR